MFNLSLKMDVVPGEWEEAKILLLFKKGSKTISDNHRLLSLTSVLCKLLERLFKKPLARS